MTQRSLPIACKSFEPDLVLYYYGELSGPERGNIERHVENCESCRAFLIDMGSLLPLTVASDAPPSTFWDAYTREIRQKLVAAEGRQSWWKKTMTFLRPWPVPAFATAAVVVLALTLTIGQDVWRPQETPPPDEALMEFLPIAENLEFFKAMEFLDAMDLLESWGGPANGLA